MYDFDLTRGSRMKEFIAGQFDIAVIGAGHAGIEAALAAARERAIWCGSWTF